MAGPLGATPVEDTESSGPKGASLVQESTGPQGASLSQEGPKGASLVSQGSASGTVTNVEDADTVTVKDKGGKEYIVRLAKIDAPETTHNGKGRDQAFGQEAKKYLSDRLLNKDVSIDWSEQDEHGRYVATVKQDGKDVNLDLVRGGYAHHYSRYDSSPDYAAAYQEAIKNKVGLWKDDKHPQSPEAFRRDTEDPTGWKRFKFSDVPAAMGREAGAVVDSVWGLIPMAVNAGGMIAETIAPVVGKDPKSVSKNTDKLVEQLSDPVRKAVGGKEEKWASTGVNQLLTKFGHGVEAVADPIADATKMTDRQRSVFKDALGITAAELTGGLLGKLKLGDKALDKLTTPTDKERADYLDRKAKAQEDFDFAQKQKAYKQEFKDAESIEIKGVGDSGEAPKGAVDSETGEIKEPEAKKPTAIDDFKEGVKQRWEGLKSSWNELTKKEEVKADQSTRPDISVELPVYVEINNVKVPVEQAKVLDAEGNQRFQPVGGRPVAATHRRMPDGSTKIIMDTDQIKADFDAKIWTEPKVDGVDPLPEDAFKTPQEYANFILEHEQAHGRTSFEDWAKREAKDGTKEELKGAYEDAMNREAADAITKAREAQERAEKAAVGTEEEWNKFLKDNKKDLEDRAQQYFNESGIAPIQGPTADYKSWAEMIKDAIGVNINEVLWADHRVKNFVKDIKKQLPKLEDRIKVFEAIQRHMVDSLPERLKDVAKMYENTMREWGKEFYEAGMLKGLLEDYASRIIKAGTDPSLINKAMEAFAEKMGGDFKTKSKFQKSRMIESYDMLLDTLAEHGIDIERDLAKVAQTYGQAMFKAKANAELIKYLKNFELVDGYKVFKDTREEGHPPYGYKTITGGQFDGYAVHPDIYPAIRWLMEPKDMGMTMRALSSISGIVKRLDVGVSLFHNTTLLVGSAFANSVKTNNYFNPVAHYKAMAEAYSKAYDSGRLKAWNDAGGRFGAEMDAGVGAVEQAAHSIDKWIADAGGFQGDLTQKTVEWASKPQKLLDKITWDITHDGSKLLTMEALLEKAKLDYPNVSEAKLMKEIATHVNDVYGGIDWYEVARDSNKFLENLKMARFSPEGRSGLQILMFAPDWTLSTLRVFARAIPESLIKPHEWNIAEGLAGLQKPLTAADHARRYQMRAMFYLLTVANGLNISLSGHAIWDNKEFFSIELGDGSAIHPFKHYSEAFKWLSDFNKTAINKLGFVPRWFIKQSDKSWKDSMKELGKDVLPFSLTGATKGVPEAVGGFVGVPMTGKHEGKIGGAGFQKNWERAMKRAQRKLGIPIKYEENEE